MSPEDALDAAIAEIDREMNPLEQTLAGLRARRRSLVVAREALGGVSTADLPKQWQLALETMRPFGFGISFQNLHAEFTRARGEPIAENSFAAQLSKMKREKLIHKRGDRWFSGPEDDLDDIENLLG